MKTYWDLTERERSQLDEEEIGRYLEIERMEKGAVRPETPKFETVVEPQELVTRTMFVVKLDDYTKGEVAYETAEEAHAAIPGPTGMRLRHDYSSKIDYVAPVELAVEPVQVVDQEVFNKERVAREAYKRARDHNEKMQADYEKEMDKYHTLDTELRDDWFECQRTDSRHAKVTRTFAEYVETADGDTGVARNFLRKAFTDGEIIEAFDWFGLELPSTEEATAAEAEEVA
jgi:hypothetical protein